MHKTSWNMPAHDICDHINKNNEGNNVVFDGLV